MCNHNRQPQRLCLCARGAGRRRTAWRGGTPTDHAQCEWVGSDCQGARDRRGATGQARGTALAAHTNERLSLAIARDLDARWTSCISDLETRLEPRGPPLSPRHARHSAARAKPRSHQSPRQVVVATICSADHSNGSAGRAGRGARAATKLDRTKLKGPLKIHVRE